MVNFKSISEAHSYNTRNSSVNYHVSRDLAKSQGTFAFTAIKAWNSLPASIKCLTELKIFRRKLKDSLSQSYTDWMLRIDELLVHGLKFLRYMVFSLYATSFSHQVVSSFFFFYLTTCYECNFKRTLLETSFRTLQAILRGLLFFTICQTCIVIVAPLS